MRFRLLLCMVLLVHMINGDTVHLMSVTSTPFGASLPGASFSCLLSDPDTDQLNSITSQRHVMRGSSSPYDILTLPPGSTTTTSPSLQIFTNHLPDSVESQGVFYCETSSRGLTTRVPVTILANNRHIQPYNGLFTFTANAGDATALVVSAENTPAGYDGVTDIRWQRQGDGSDTFDIVQEGGTLLIFNPVSVSDAGVYATYWAGMRTDFLFSLTRLIVRECPQGRWDPPICISICDNCYNGGICDDKTGECVCRPGFTGPNCLTACGLNKFGWDCEHQCGVGLAVSEESCFGSVFCMPDPVGCSCMTGYTGAECNQGCRFGVFGAGCTQQCHCASGGCDAFTGVCIMGSCAEGWSGTSCQIPITCEAGYFGDMCLDKCNCQCNKVTGSCLQASECLTGFYGSNCENECHCDNCDRNAGCINSQCLTGFYGSNCENECHCDNCDRTTGCVNSQQCYDGFWGPDCETECHCLNAAACDMETGKCDPDSSTGLSLCEPGYVSDTGVNLDNCQQSEGCFDNCTKTCHCRLGSPTCNDVTGGCGSQGCDQNWNGASCQTGIIELTYVKANANQPVSITCTVTGNPDVPDANQVILYYNDEQGGQQFGTQMEAENQGMFVTVVFEARPTDGNTVSCILSIPGEIGATSAHATITVEYFDLPVMLRPPSIGNILATLVTLEWDAWGTDPRDTGDGPVIAYNVYYIINGAPVLAPNVTVMPETPSVITAVVSSLTPGTTYNFYVTAVREGTGGEGPPAQFVPVTTFSITTKPPQTTPPITTATIPPAPTTERVTTVAPTTTKVQTTTKQTTKIFTRPDTTSTIVETSSTNGMITKSVPGPPREVTAIAVEETSITLEWISPINPNGVIIFYHIDHRAIQRQAQSGHETFTNSTLDVRGISETHYSFVMPHLEPATAYEVYISAENMNGEGPSVQYLVFTEDAKASPSSGGSSAGGSSAGAAAAGASVAVIVAIIIVAVIVVFVIRKGKGGQGDSEEQEQTNNDKMNRFMNEAFNVDEDENGYEDADLDDVEYEEVTSSKWNIAWEDLSLSGKILGKGNFGKVQLGKVRIKDKWIKAAVKTLKDGTPESERALFKEEFDTMTRIGHHPNVVNILGSCENAGSFYVILEYVPHGNLRKFLRKSRRELKGEHKKESVMSMLNPDQLFKFAIGVAKAMKHIANCGIIHRDLAARNVLVGRGLTPKVADFGMSRGENIYVQTSSQRVPTRWLSIESLTNKKYTSKSDVWSFGILLWEITTFGGTPYPDMETKYLAYNLTDGYRMPKPDNCEDDMYTLMLKCWREDPDERPSFAEIVDILTDMSAKEKIYMSTHYYQNFKYAAISLDKDDK